MLTTSPEYPNLEFFTQPVFASAEWPIFAQAVQDHAKTNAEPQSLLLQRALPEMSAMVTAQHSATIQQSARETDGLHLHLRDLGNLITMVKEELQSELKSSHLRLAQGQQRLAQGQQHLSWLFHHGELAVQLPATNLPAKFVPPQLPPELALSNSGPTAPASPPAASSSAPPAASTPASPPAAVFSNPSAASASAYIAAMSVPVQQILPPLPPPPVYNIYASKTVADVWREWKEGIRGGPAIEMLEERWGAKWRPSSADRTAFCRLKIVIDELLRLQTGGLSAIKAVDHLDGLRNGKSLANLVVRLRDERRARAVAKENTV
jgi:hypothetical protein